MTVPHAHQQLAAFNTAYADPIDPSTQVDRLPGTDAPCMCHDPFFSNDCRWPYCDWKPETKEDE